MTGNQNMWSGFGKSVNTYFVQLEQAVGADKVVKMAERLGLRWRSEADRYYGPTRCAPPAGARSRSASPTPRRWRWPTPTPPSPPTGSTASRCRSSQILDPATARTLAQTQVPPGDPGRRRPRRDRRGPLRHRLQGRGRQLRRLVHGAAASTGIVGRPVAGKTGTTDDTRAAWFVGFTPQLAGASFIADPDYPPTPSVTANSQKPVNTVSELLRDGLAGQPIMDFTYP